MFILKKIGCRVFQLAFRAALPLLPYREPEIVPSCEGLCKVFSEKRSTSVLIVTDAGILKNGLVAPVENVLKKNKIRYALFDKTQPNPTVGNVEEALRVYRRNNCDTLIAVGGGSAMDCAKAVGAKTFMEAIRALNAKMKIPDTIQGIRKEDIFSMAKHAEKEANPLYPVPKLMTRRELEGFYERVGGIYEKN